MVPEFNWSNIAPPYLDYQYFRPTTAPNSRFVRAGHLIDASILAYADPIFAQGVFEKAGYDFVDYIDGYGSQCYVFRKNGEYFVAFRGTQSNLNQDNKHRLEVLMDVWTDLNTVMVRRSGALIHAGFWNGLDCIWDRLFKRIENRLTTFTGHSLGGALATVAAFRFKKTRCCNEVVTFGSPRVGNAEFREEMHRVYGKEGILRYVHGRDGVPTVPMEYLGFYHVGRKIVLGEKHDGEEPGKFRRGCLPMPRRWVPIPPWIYDHVPVLYAHHIWQDA